jgi:hypothetical protein
LRHRHHRKERLESRIATTLSYHDADEACDAAFVAGPVALAWSRLDAAARNRARSRYLESIAAWRHDGCLRIPAQFLIVAASVNPIAPDDSR